jgi:predicted nucleotidyltransferase component of viral defense system
MDDSSVNDLTPRQFQHLAFMRAIVRGVADTPMTLKGGTGLLLGHGLDRFSEDLDFDSTVTLNLEARIQKAASAAGVDLINIRVKKDTEIVKRYMVSYAGPNGSGTLKIETSRRSDAIDPQSVVVRDGMRVYGVDTLIDQKLTAAESRAKVRDLYDLEFLARSHRDRFTAARSVRLSAIAGNPDNLVGRYALDHQADALLSERSLDDLALSLSVSASEIAKGTERAGNAVLETAVEIERQQDALLDTASMDDRYSSTLASYVQEKHDQVERLESRLESLLERQQAQLAQLQGSPPRLLALPSARAAWRQAQEVQKSTIISLQNRLEAVREIKDAMGLHAPRVEEMAHRKMRTQHRELAQAWDASQVEIRRQQVEQRASQTNQKVSSRGVSLRREAQ